MLKKIIHTVSGSAASAIANLIGYPLIIVLYTSTDYGFFALFLIPATIISSFSLLKLDILVATVEPEEYPIVELYSLWLSLIFTIACFFISLIYFIKMGDTSIVSKAILSSVYLFLFQNFTFKNALNISAGNTALVGIVMFIYSVLTVTMQAFFSMFFNNEFGLIYGLNISLFIANIIYLYISKSNPFLNLTLSSLKGIIRFIKINSKIVYPSTTQGILNSMSVSFHTLVVSYLGGAQLVGVFNLCMKILMVPIRVFSSNIRQIMTRNFADSTDPQTNLKVVKKLTLIMAILSFVIFAITNAIFINYYSYLPKGWQEIGIVIFPISIWLAFAFIYSPALAYMTSRQENYKYLVFEAFNLLSRVVVGVSFIIMEYEPVMYLYASSLMSALLILVLIKSIIWKT